VSEPNSRASTYLDERGISKETVDQHKIELHNLEPENRVLPETYRRRLGLDVWNNKALHEVVEESIWFPCMDEHTTIHSWIVRLFPVLPSKNGSGEVKFITPKGGDGYPFIPQATWKVKDKPNQPLLITEGPCKALAALQAGAFPIAFCGVWQTAMRSDDGTALHPVLLEHFTFRGRMVFVGFDADFATNPRVRQALIRTTVLLHKAGAEVKVLTWDPADGKGLDDYLVKAFTGPSDGADVLQGLYEKSCTLAGVIRECDLEFIEFEMTRARLKGSKLAQLCRVVGPSLKVSAETLKDGIKSECEEQEYALSIKPPEPWPEPVIGFDLANELVTIVNRHIALKEVQAQAVALWIILTYLDDVVYCLPILALLSPVKRCGKTTLLSLLSRVVNKPLTAASISTAAIYRVIELLHPTLLIDEVDTWIKDNNEARGILNSGHTRDAAYVIRCNADSNEPERFSTWAPKVLSAIGELPDTLTDRSITIQIERRSPEQKVAKVRDADPAQFTQVRQKLVRWALDHRDNIANARPEIPKSLNDRQSDNWEALLAIANLLGGDWSQNARKSALTLSDADDADTITTLLLSKIREVLNDLPDDRNSVPTDHLIKCLNADKEAPWADWSHGNGITPHKLAKLLKPFGVKSGRVWDGASQVMSYTRESLKPVFGRYLPLEPPENDSEAAVGS
jgi:hypothetical protein